MYVLLNCLAFQSLVVPETRRVHYISSLRLYLLLAVICVFLIPAPIDLTYMISLKYY